MIFGRHDNYPCSICGLPTTGRTWWSDIRLLCDPDDEVDKLCPDIAHPDVGDIPSHHRSTRSEIQVYMGQWREGSIFGVWSPEVSYMVEVAQYALGDHVHIPVHSVCLDMAKRAFSSPESYIRDMRGLWTALRWRIGIANTECLVFDRGANYTLADNKFYIPSWRWWNHDYTRLEVGTNSPDTPLVDWVDIFAGNPLETEKFTETLLLNLRECPRDPQLDREAEALRAGLNTLPIELLYSIYEILGSPRGLPLTATYVLPQYFWMDLLKSCKALPWLWDVDPDLIDAKAAEPCPGGTDFEWDWELLVRQLSQGVDFGIRDDLPFEEAVAGPEDEQLWACTGYKDNLEYVPAGLHNRRRIWQLLEEMFVGDRLPTPQNTRKGPRGRCLIMPWTKSGDVADKPTWIPSVWACHLLRRVGGSLHWSGMSTPEKLTLEYWQMCEHLNQGLTLADMGLPTKLSGAQPQRCRSATAEEIYEDLRKIGYPV